MPNKRKKEKIREVSKVEHDDTTVGYCFREFIAEKKAEGLVKSTIKQYESNFREFFRYLNEADVMEEHYMGDITKTLITQWVPYMREKGLKTTTINTRLCNIRTFLYWCMEEDKEYLDNFRIKTIRTQEEKPKDYTLEEVKALLRKPDKKCKFPEWRSWAICCFVMGTGARIGTVIEIKMEDVDLERGRVYYRHTKNKHLQEVNITPQLSICLKEYIKKFRWNADRKDYLFCNVSGDKLTDAAFRGSYTNYTKKRGVNKTNIHGLRHTFAREWFMDGGDVVQLSKVLGHSSISMTMHYMDVYAIDKREAFIEANPLERILAKGKRRKELVTGR